MSEQLIRNPLALARQRAAAQLTAAAGNLGISTPALPEQLHFCPGDVGQLATPYPKIHGLNPVTLAENLREDALFSAVCPAGEWLQFTLSPIWLALARENPSLPAEFDLELPPVPPFPARMIAQDWRLCHLLGKGDALIAARLDEGNPAVFLRNTLDLAKNAAGEDRQSARLVTLCAAVREPRSRGDALQTARGLWTLGCAYRRSPGEDTLVAATLEGGLCEGANHGKFKL